MATTKPVILGQKNGETADILFPHTSADLTGYENEAVPEVKDVAGALDELFKKSPGEAPDLTDLTGRVEALETAQDGLAEKNHANAETTYGAGTGELYGHVKLSDATDGTETAAEPGGVAATPKAVADAMAAASAAAKAAQAWTKEKPGIVKRVEAVEAKFAQYLPLSGGTMTGVINLNNSGKKFGDLFTYTDSNTQSVGLEADSASKDDGGCILLYTKDSTSNAGGFQLSARNGTSGSIKSLIGKIDGSLSWNGKFTATDTITGKLTYNAVWNDYAEFFPRASCGEGFAETQPGDIIAFDREASAHEGRDVYRAAREGDNCLVGVHSDSFGHLIGGETPPEGKDFVAWNIGKFIPVGLAGRVWCRMENVDALDSSALGSRVTPSAEAGAGRLWQEGDDPRAVVGFTVRLPDEEHPGRVLLALSRV